MLDHRFWIEIVISIVCGAILGAERELRGKPTGMRPCILLVLGTAMFVRLGVIVSHDSSELARLIGQVATGIGFLGAGVMIVRGEVVVGVTTATVVWVLAAIGAMIGAGEWAGALTVTIVTLLVLITLESFDKYIEQYNATRSKLLQKQSTSEAYRDIIQNGKVRDEDGK